MVKVSLVPRPLPDFISQLWRKLSFSPWLKDKIWEWPGKEVKVTSEWLLQFRTGEYNTIKRDIITIISLIIPSNSLRSEDLAQTLVC